MTSKLEQVARAIDPVIWNKWDRVRALLTDEESALEFDETPSLTGSIDRARAAIAAMELPTPAMLEAASEASHDAQHESGKMLSMSKLYEIMIRAALKEEKA